jgi:hypothetical protein
MKYVSETFYAKKSFTNAHALALIRLHKFHRRIDVDNQIYISLDLKNSRLNLVPLVFMREMYYALSKHFKLFKSTVDKQYWVNDVNLTLFNVTFKEKITPDNIIEFEGNHASVPLNIQEKINSSKFLYTTL